MILRKFVKNADESHSINLSYMITETHTHHCGKCGSTNIVRNGINHCGNQQYLCKDCRTCRVLSPKSVGYSAERREEFLALYQSAAQYARGRTGNRCLSAYIGSMDKKKVALSPTIEETLLPAEPDDVLELDEVWSFVQKRANKRWLWTAICRRTRQIVAAVVGDRSAKTCQKLWEVIPESYRRCHSYSDFWEAYSLVFDEETHRSVGKETGETAHMERWNNTLRQRVGRYVRKTLSFSKLNFWHQIVTEMFIVTYNPSCVS